MESKPDVDEWLVYLFSGACAIGQSDSLSGPSGIWHPIGQCRTDEVAAHQKNETVTNNNF